MKTLEKMKQVNGEDEDRMLRDAGDQTERSILNRLSLAELKEMAQEHGVFPSDNKQVLILRLRSALRR